MRFFLIIVLLALAACAPARLDRAAVANANIITDFNTDKGDSGKYKVGEQLKFSFKLSRAAYITLLSFGPTGNTVSAETNILMSTGSRVLPRADDRVGTAVAAYVVSKPLGITRAILIASDVPLKGSFKGTFGNGELQNLIQKTLQNSNSQTFDTAETQLEVTE